MRPIIFSFVRNAFSKPLSFFGVFFLVFTLTYSGLFAADVIPEPNFQLQSFFDHILLLGIIAGVLQLIGYYYYLTDDHIDPNPVTWFMFAYGTLVLAVLEWDIDATFAELILPTVCGALAIVVSFQCWRKARKINPNKWWPEDWWPEDFWDKFSFIGDISITIGYVAVWALATFAVLTTTEREWAVFAFLFLSNLSTFPAFYPILHSTWTNPEREHWIPWVIWALAYAILGFVTYEVHGELWHALMFYPASNALLHALVGILALRKERTNVKIV